VLLRLLLVAVLLGAGAGLTWSYRRRRTVDERSGAVLTDTGERRWPDLPDDIGGDAGEPDTPKPSDRTWVIFTTPMCVSCESVRADLIRHDPASRVLTIDVTVRPDLSDRYGVRRAPTTILADRHGHVVERLVGPEGVRTYLQPSHQPARPI